MRCFCADARSTGSKGNKGAATRAAPNLDKKLRLEVEPASRRVVRSHSLSTNFIEIFPSMDRLIQPAARVAQEHGRSLVWCHGFART